MKKEQLREMAKDIFFNREINKRGKALIRISKLDMLDLIYMIHQLNSKVTVTTDYKKAADKVTRILRNALTARNFNFKMSSSEF